MQEKNTRGGKRAGAGRKPSGRHDVRVRLTPEEHEVFKRLGGSNWLAPTDVVDDVRILLECQAVEEESH